MINSPVLEAASVSQCRGEDSQRSEEDPPFPIRDIFPVLGSPPAQWTHDIAELLDYLPSSYLSNGTDSEISRDRCARLPALLNSYVQGLSRITGAYISARAVWPDLEDPENMQCYSTITERASQYILPEDAVEEIAYMVHQVCYGAGPLLERRSMLTYPVIYSTVEAKGRPLLCPPHPSLIQRRQTLVDWFSTLRQWQGLPMFTWSDVLRSIELGGKPYFSHSRVPQNFPFGKLPADWAAEQVDVTYAHILFHQGRFYGGDRGTASNMFQWLEKDLNEPLRTFPAGPVDHLYAEQSAAYFLAISQHKFRDDAYLPLTEVTGRWFTPDFMARYSHILTPKVIELVKCTELIQRLNQPERVPSESDPILLRLAHAAPEDPVEFLENFTIPEATYDYDNDEHNVYSVGTVARFVSRSESMITSSRVYGGRSGIYLVCQVTLAIAKLIDDMQQGRVKLTGQMFDLNWSSREGRILTTMIDSIVECVHLVSSANSCPGINQNPQTTAWRPRRITCVQDGDRVPQVIEWPHNGWGTDSMAGGLSRVTQSPSPSSGLPKGTITGTAPETVITHEYSAASNAPLSMDSGISRTGPLMSPALNQPPSAEKGKDTPLIKFTHNTKGSEGGQAGQQKSPQHVDSNGSQEEFREVVIQSHGQDEDTTASEQCDSKSIFNLYGNLMNKERATVMSKPAPIVNATPLEQRSCAPDKITRSTLPPIQTSIPSKLSLGADTNPNPGVFTDVTDTNALGLQPFGIDALSASTPGPRYKTSTSGESGASRSTVPGTRGNSCGPGSGLPKSSVLSRPPSESPSQSPLATSATSAGEGSAQTGMFLRAAGAMMSKSPNIGAGRTTLQEPRDRAVSTAPTRRMETRSSAGGSVVAKRGTGDRDEGGSVPPGSPNKRHRSKSQTGEE